MYWFVALLISSVCVSSLYALDAPSLEHGEKIFQQCVGCHGSNGKNKAFGRSGIIAGQPQDALMQSLKMYHDNDFKDHGTALVMSKQIRNMSPQDMSDVAFYISKLPK